ncbi:GntR family transcriptional regulator [Aliidongia dinghuensis]|uniref:GntR family transcriptional regulator n=1 Tax=Aliidongia dinghuensis TaxID=1867774 RepID=A0A8J2YUM4_9PROT|nr:GntR family transcriptional regulator [Aliidongia dinghuensis]
MERVTLGDRVHRQLRELLMAGKLMPGEKLSLRSVAASLGVSMMPVREAVAQLVAEDALTVLPNRAISVPVMTKRRFRELRAIRVMLEGYAAEQAAQQRGEADLAQIREADAQFRRAVSGAAPDPVSALRWNMNLHFAVYRAAQSPSLLTIIEGLWLKVGPVINLDLRASAERLSAGASERLHARLLAAIEAGDGAGARAALVEDINGSAAFIEATGNLPD